MKPRAKHLHDVLMGTKPGRHRDKKKVDVERQVKEEMREARHYKFVKRMLDEDRSDDFDD